MAGDLLCLTENAGRIFSVSTLWVRNTNHTPPPSRTFKLASGGSNIALPGGYVKDLYTKVMHLSPFCEILLPQLAASLPLRR
jgi:hypothetical protein